MNGSSFDDYAAHVEATAGPDERTELAAARTWMEAAYAARFGLGDQVAELRKRRGLTQEQLAASCGLGQALISRIEHGKANPTQETLQRIGRALGASLVLLPD